MKKLLSIFTAGLFVFASCDEVKELADFEIGHTFEYTLNMDITDADSVAFEEEITVDTSVDPNFQDNLSNIKNYSVETLNLSVTSFQGTNTTTANGKVQFFGNGIAVGQPITVPTMEFEALLQSGESVAVIIPEDIQAELEQKLMDAETITVRLFGEVSEKPMNADILVALRIEATVGVN